MAPPEIRIRVRTPHVGYQKVSVFNRSCVTIFDEFLLISLGLVKGRESLGEISFLMHKGDLERNRENNMKYLEEVAKTGAKESDNPPWQPLLPIDNPPIVSQLSAINSNGLGELTLVNISARAVWEHTQEYKSDKEITVDPQPLALMRSSIADQMALIIQIYAQLKSQQEK